VQTLNRSAIVVTPKKPFLDWIRSVDPFNRELKMADMEMICLFTCFRHSVSIRDRGPFEGIVGRDFEQELES
jgi:hypothetical protein